MRKVIILLIHVLFLISGTKDLKAIGHNIIPKPKEITIKAGEYIFNSKSTISFNNKDKKLCEIVDYFNDKLGFTLKEGKKGSVNLVINEMLHLPQGGYIINVNSDGINIESSNDQGIFYGIQTLLQLMPSEIKDVNKKNIDGIKIPIPLCYIKDSPEFEWRGLMLDVSRHWFTKEEVKRYIDQLSEYKMNVFHWHLTDDQGWRVEIKSHPKLTEKGSLRAKRVGKWWQRESQSEDEESTYGGYYTHEDIKEIVEYARQRYVRVIPEIDVPGHSLATLFAYPNLACLNAPKAVNVGNKFYGIDENSLCIGNPETYKLMEDVFSEIAQLFPDEYIHVGGDECFKGFWAKCPKCQELMKKEKFSHINDLQSFFIRKMEHFLKSKGKKLIGWDEISEGGLAPEATVMSWRGMKGGIDAAKAGHHVIMTPFDNCYLDLYQGDRLVEPDTYSLCRLSDSYAFNPVPEGVQKELILGGQGNLWTESVPTMRHAEYMTWPRGWALAEVLWSGTSNKDWPNFISRVENHFIRADHANINYARSMYDAITTSYQDENSRVHIKITSEIPSIDIYYTFDNTDPDSYTEKYCKPLTIPKDATWLKVVTYRDGIKIGKIITHPIDKLKENSVGKKAGNK